MSSDVHTLTFEVREWEQELLIKFASVPSLRLTKVLEQSDPEAASYICHCECADLAKVCECLSTEATKPANRAIQGKLDALWVHITDMLDGELENTPVDEFSGVLSHLLPPELIPFFNENFEDKEFTDVEELRKSINEVVKRYNGTPDPNTAGLSKEQVAMLIYSDWEAEGSVLKLSSKLTFEEVREIFFLKNCRRVLLALHEAGAIKATATGNFCRRFVVEIAKMMRTDDQDRIAGFLLERGKAFNELDIWDLHIMRLILDLGGLLRLRKGKFYMTKKGKGLLEEEKAGELFVLLFKVFFQKFNLAYIDTYEEHEMIQDTIAYSFYGLSWALQDWKSVEEVYSNVLLPMVRKNIPPSSGIHRPELRLVVERILEPFQQFGLLQSRNVRSEDKPFGQNEYKKTPLFDRFIQFDFDPSSKTDLEN